MSDINITALERWLQSHIDCFAGPVEIDQFQGGRSNPTYKLSSPTHTLVMRTKPGPASQLLLSAHAIEREFRLMSVLKQTDVPVPKLYCLCDDESVIGRAFFVMEFIAGRVLFEQSLPGLEPSERTAIFDEANRVIANLQGVDWQGLGLSDFGRPGNYFARQIDRWSKQYRACSTDTVGAMDRLIEWLPGNIPSGDETTLVHGDYRLDNLIYDSAKPEVRAVLDWELSTLGHPLADFSYHCLTWHLSPKLFRGAAGLNHAELGIPSEAEYVRSYCERTGRKLSDVMENWNFYIAYNLFRLAAILQGVARRAADGMSASAGALDEGKRVRPLAELGWNIARYPRG